MRWRSRYTVIVATVVCAANCTELDFNELDMKTEVNLRDPDVSGELSAGVRSAGVMSPSGEVSGATAGGLELGGVVLSGEMTGGLFGLSPFTNAGEVGGALGGEIGGETPSASRLCGSDLCDINATCVSGASGPRCQCHHRYEGDGVSCEPTPCPPYASGAPECSCDEGYEGALTFELSTQTWVGACAPINPCQLITIRGDAFIETSDPLLGDTLFASCVSSELSSERYRFSLSEGDVYAYEELIETDNPCESTGSDDLIAPVNAWPFSGGVLTDRGLFHVRSLVYSRDECVYDVLGVRDDSQLDLVYLAPTGRSCASGDARSITCGRGACLARGEMVCEAGEWVERCAPSSPQEGLDLCNGLDDDCDDSIDEDFTAESTECGVGVCASTGITSCTLGLLSDSCEPTPAQGVDASCDGEDNDCDGRVDEAFTTRLISCGDGVCSAEGVIICRDGAEETLCTPNSPTGEDVDCDNVDEDCDGSADEGYVGEAVRCGVGACLFDGFTRCIDGVAEEACTPLEPAEDDASCDGVDQDCDGRLDEDYVPQLTTCGLGVCSNTGVTECVGGEERDLCAPRPALGEDHECDGVDADCDGRADEAFESVPSPCSGAGVYECAVTAPMKCIEGQVDVDCASALEAQSDETCDGLDDDCDGQLDEDYLSVEVSCGLGECADTSMSRCVNGEVSDRCLIRAPTGDDSDCDGRDDDCDGVSDESFVAREVSCGQGVCVSIGVARCVDGRYESECQPAEPLNPDESACDNIDNDCDGRVDEAFSSARNDCGLGVCYAIGSSSCRDGVVSTNCEPLPATGDDADCDGIDQDCDDRADESYPPIIDECGQGVCYNTADSSCVEGEVQNNCVPLPQQGDDSSCDGVDQDCDGRVDEAYQPVPTTCTYGSVCVQEGLTACVSGQVRDVCDPPVFYTGSDNSCNNQDNDCDGRLDEGFVGGVFYCGSGICQGSGFRSCVNGQEGGGSCTPNNHLASDDSGCDGVDQDCDGRADEHYGSVNVSCGRGVCRRTGTQTCVNGGLRSMCSPGNPQGDDSDTNGRDDDCDGRVDEDSIPPETNCNGADDDFDGSVDEGYGVTNTTCGVGACARTGVRYCENGSVINTCVPGGSVDNSCNGQDEDCDGRLDEHYSGGNTSCGTGACARTGVRVCQGGAVNDTCTEGNPGNEVLNNNIDDDCDGTTDEGAPREPVGSVLYRCDFGGGSWYTNKLVSSGWTFYSTGLVCYRSGGFIYDATGYVFIDGTPRAPGTGECVNQCR